MNNNRVNASIITIGDELLIGQTIDTNSAWMAQQLNSLGIWVRRRVAVGDVYDEIWNALDEESRYADIILITGGLGPTADDITKPLLNTYFGGKLVLNQQALDNVKTIFARYTDRPLPDVNIRQAEVPDVCTPILNKRGTAPGMWFEKAGKVFVSMPGVPMEMKGMMEGFVLPRLTTVFKMPAVVHRTLLTAGIGESFLAERIKTFEESLPPYIKLAYLPHFGTVRLRLTGTGSDEAGLEAEVNNLFQALQQYLPDVMVINEDKSLEEAIGLLLHSQGKSVATAESCTGGYVAHLLTSIPGASAYFMGGVVTYAYSAKSQVLGVDTKTLETTGAVSEETVVEMAQGARTTLNADFALSISGILGPGGGTADKPVGTVWMAVASAGKTYTQQFFARFDRKRNIEVTAINALVFLRKCILSELEPQG